MAQAEGTPEHITAFERAVCYYTIPRVITPVSLGLVAAYAVCVLEAIGVLVTGIVIESRTWTYAGAGALAAIVILGVAVFFVRSVAAHVRAQRVLRLAHQMPEPSEESLVPDPFRDHALLRFARAVEMPTFPITTDSGEILYTVNYDNLAGCWQVRAPQDEELCEARVVRSGGSFMLGGDTPGAVDVFKGCACIGRIRRRLRLPEPDLVIEQEGLPNLRVSARGLYRGEQLVGRIYYLRDYLYLDVESEWQTASVLAHYVTYGRG